MNTKRFYQSWDLYINGTRVRRYYSKNKAISIGQRESSNLFNEHIHIEVVDTHTGEVVWNS